MILCISTCIYNVHAYRLYMYFSLLCAWNIILTGSLWAILTDASQIMCWKSCASPWRKRCASLWYQSAASSHPDGIWPMQLSFLLNASLMSQRDHTTSLSCAVRFRASAAQGSSWPWPLAGFVQLRCLTLVHCRWGSCRWALRVCKLKPCKIRKVKTGRTECAELGTVLGIGDKYWCGI